MFILDIAQAINTADEINRIWKWQQNFWRKNVSYVNLNISRTKNGS